MLSLQMNARTVRCLTTIPNRLLPNIRTIARARSSTRNYPNLKCPARPKSTSAIGGPPTKAPSPPAAAAAAASSSSTKESIPITQTLLAMTAGVLTVTAAAATVESVTSSSIPPFSPDGQRYSQSSFSGRFCRMLLMCDPRLTFYTDDEVRRCRAMVSNYRHLIANPPPEVENIHRTLWEAHRVSSAALHPDTDQSIPRPFRMSGYVLYNGPICVSMVASSSTPALLFWGWMNQSQNALINYFNRNASSDMSNETLGMSYAAAVGSALAVVFGLASVIKRRVRDPARVRQLLRFVAFPSSVVASSLNCYVVRSPEIDTGIPVVDEEG
eukprot:CAMPEP_0172499316 /NCGR_PEP_ID=MMETSP1066-20121228/125504_1 /TAXON_ID=671091 /ORGANISM="Coscinodiscus wailesii, Strain CCMP2513" /LENGTH=326 /DNA_ID=CAMNT_0013272991 /DNA_START=82 /DNA_END=1059 /DNA_ORIENTATION=+